DPDPRGVPGGHRRDRPARRGDLPVHELRPDRGVPGRGGSGDRLTARPQYTKYRKRPAHAGRFPFHELGRMYAPAMGPAGRRSSRPTSRSRRVAAAFAIALCLLVLAVPAAWATARQVGEHQWEGVDRIVAIGDLHGDYGSYMA